MNKSKSNIKNNSYKKAMNAKRKLLELKWLECFTFWLKEFGPKNAMKSYIKYMDKTPAVSVGSGNGVFEKSINLEGIDVICIDPVKSVNNDDCKWGLKPKYKYVKNALRKEPSLKGQNLILIAPYTFMFMGDGSEYDIEAIKLLKPKKIFLLVDLAGTSGSYDLIHSIIAGKDKVIIDKNNRYKVLYQKTKKVIKFEEDENEDLSSDGGDTTNPFYVYGRKYMISLLVLEKY